MMSCQTCQKAQNSYHSLPYKGQQLNGLMLMQHGQQMLLMRSKEHSSTLGLSSQPFAATGNMQGYSPFTAAATGTREPPKASCLHTSIRKLAHAVPWTSAPQTVNNGFCCSCRFPWHPSCQHISARGCSVSAADLQQAASRGRAHLERQQQQQQQQSLQQTWWLAQLVPVALQDDQPFLQDLAAAILAHNSRVLQQQQQQQDRLQGTDGLQQPHTQPCLPPLIVPLLVQTVRQTAAAVSLQSAWRSHNSRLQERVADRLLFNRAACCIERVWQACKSTT
jgi:hypothetical protein